MSSRTTIATPARATQRPGYGRARAGFQTGSQRRGFPLLAALVILYAPFALGTLLNQRAEASIAWSFAGSVFIAAIAQTRLFSQTPGEISFTHSLLRPAFMFHMIFIAYHVVGGSIHVLNKAGYVLWEYGAPQSNYDPTLLAECQRLMLFAHTSVTAGMALVGFRYVKPAYRVSFSHVPPTGMLAFAILAQGAGAVMRTFPALFSFGEKTSSLGEAAILVQIVLAIRAKSYLSLVQAVGVFGITFAAEAMSGWKGSILWTAIALGAWLYPLSPKVTITAALVFVAFWGLWFYPFASNLRRPLWYEGLERERAISIALEQTQGLTVLERAEGLWDSLAVRGSDLNHFEKYITFVPENHPYYGLDMVRNAVIALTPRILWRDKPDIERLSMERVYEAGITYEEVIVSAKSNLYQDGYLAAGYTGVFIMCLAFGCLAMWISQTCERLFGGYDLGTGLIYLGLFATPINQAQNTEFVLSSLAGSAVVAVLLFGVGRSAGWLVVNTTPHTDTRLR